MRTAFWFVVVALANGCGPGAARSTAPVANFAAQKPVDKPADEPKEHKIAPASIEEMNLGIELAQLGRFSPAETHLVEALKIDANNHPAHYALGQVLEAQHKWDGAIKAFGEAARLNPKDAMYRYRLGHALLENEDGPNVREAEALLSEAIALNDRLFKAHYYRGVARSKSDRPKLAAQDYTRACELAPTWGRSFVALSKLYLQWDYYEQALQVAMEGIKHVTDPMALSDLYYYVGLNNQKRSKWSPAVDAYSKALGLRTDHIDARRQRGFAYAKMGKRDKAIADLEAFVRAGGGGNAFQIQAANDMLRRLNTSRRSPKKKRKKRRSKKR